MPSTCAMKIPPSKSSSNCPRRLFGTRTMALWLQRSNVGCEDIPISSHCLDQVGSPRINLDLPAQTAHLIVDASIKKLRRATGGKVKKLVTGEHNVRPMHKHLQKTELRRAEGDRHRVGALQLTLVQIEDP